MPAGTVTGESKNKTEYTFTVEHAPEEHNYSHCELRVYKNLKRARDGSKTVKRRYREELAKHLRLEISPEADLIS